MGFKMKGGTTTRSSKAPAKADTASAMPGADAPEVPAQTTATYAEELARGGGVVSPFTPTVLRVQDFEGVSDEEKLARLRTALEVSRATAEGLDARVKMRAVIEAGTILRLMRHFQVHLLAGHETFESFVVDDLGFRDRRRVYDLIEDAGNLVAVLPLTTANRRAIPASQAAILAPVMKLDDGEKRAQDALDAARASHPEGRVTAARLRQAVTRIGIPAATDTSTGAAPGRRPQADPQRAAVDDAFDRLVGQAEDMLTALDRLKAAGVPPADPARVEAAVNKLRAAGRRIARTAAVPEEIVDAEVVG
ncbi:hypothetical protein [Streptomyces uncialis]|uniref:hypothetical protein n=1 Tax=Streptomyces uncialis TaxID=1048205 RepID=UPI0022565226|nr:hypothetical protein [Streptomyces uncialis]MCX4665033.1 hypothetical protein [Streptomyces uncialis]